MCFELVAQEDGVVFLTRQFYFNMFFCILYSALLQPPAAVSLGASAWHCVRQGTDNLLH